MEGTSSSHVAERVDSLVNSIAASIEPMFDNVPPLSSGSCIYRVPERLRSVKPEAYTPLIVSIGPFHHGDDRLEAMEHLKTQYLHSLLRQHPEISLHRYVEVLLELETRARTCYAETIPYTKYTKEEFVKMLLLDGCFLLELFRQYCYPSTRKNDQLFTNHWVFNAVHRDVLLLENQIPFFVLETLFNVLTPTGPLETPDLCHLIQVFLGHHKLFSQRDWQICWVKEEPLLLSVLVSITQFEIQNPKNPTSLLPIQNPKNPASPTFIPSLPSATELNAVGITFEGSSSSNLFDAHFDAENRVFHIPSLVVDDRTESFLRNLIALEQISNKTRIYGQIISQSNKIPTISAYVTLMNCLVNTFADVAFLRHQGILITQLADDDEVAQLFNKLRIGMIMNPYGNCFSEVFKNVSDYHTNWKVYRAMFFNEVWYSPIKKVPS